MLALKLLATYAYRPVMGSIAMQQAAVPPSLTCELTGTRPPRLVMPNDDTAPCAPAGMLVAEPKSSVTSRFEFLAKVKPKYVGNSGPGAWVTVGVRALP